MSVRKPAWRQAARRQDFSMPQEVAAISPAPPRAGERSRSGESGFAMLFVFVMAASAAWLFYRELPRIAFERQREKEQLLIERGEQYRRAIQLFVRKFNRYPAELSQLEKTSNIRFLRRRYKDPMTGKSEWRLIHAGPGGVLLDSLLNKPAGPEKEESKPAEAAGALEGGAQGPQPVVRRRPSETPGTYPVVGAPFPTAGGLVGGVDASAPGGPSSQPGAQVPNYPVHPGQPYATPQPGQTAQPGQTPQPGQGGIYYVIQPGAYPAPGIQQPVAAGQPGQIAATPGAQPGQPPYVVIPVPTGQPGSFTMPEPGQTIVVPVPGLGGQLPSAPLVPIPGAAGTQPAPYPTQNVPGLPGPYGQPGVPSIGAITIAPGVVHSQGGTPTYSTQPGVGGAPVPGPTTFPQPGYQPLPSEPTQNPALQIIRDILTKPRPGGLAGIQQQQASAGGQQVLGGGIAGVASTLEAEGIMVYNDRSKYNEWEFVYDIRKDPVKMAQMGLTPLAPGTQTDSGKTMFPQSGSQSPPSLSAPPSGTRRR